jgi:hypothetical protein
VASLLALAVLLLPARASAQAPAPAPDPPVRDSLAIGVGLAPAVAGGMGFWPTVRVSTPIGARIGIDVEAGGMFPSDNGYFSTRWFSALQFRFLRKPRDVGGSSWFWVVGPAYIVGSELDGDGRVTDPHAGITAIRVAYGGDRIYANGMRAGGEIGVIGGGSSAPTGIFASLIVQWRPRR